ATPAALPAAASSPPPPAPHAAPAESPASAYRAVESAPPPALRHVAWSDRWLARFAGASAHTLAALDATTGETAAAQQARMVAAPAPVFLAAHPGVASGVASSGIASGADRTEATWPPQA